MNIRNKLKTIYSVKDKNTEDKNLILMKKHAKEKGGECLSDRFIDNKTHLKWKCSNNHIWMSTPECVVKKKQWCRACSQTNRWVNNRERIYEELSTIAKNRGGELLSKEYKNHKQKLKWKCKFNHIWQTSADVVKNGKKWCPLCQQSHGEILSRTIIESLLESEFPSSKPKWLKSPKTNKLLELDGYNKKLKIAFEYNGQQHYKEDNTYNKNKDFSDIKYRDSIKEKLCQENGVKLIVIPYTIEYVDIKDYIIKELEKIGVKVKKNIKVDYNIIYKKSNHISYTEKFKEKINSLGYELISEYEGYTKPVTLRCEKGHEFDILARSVDRNKGCPVCRGYRKRTTNQIKKICDDKNIIFMEKKYIPGKRFKVKCRACEKTLKLRHSDLDKYTCKCEENGK